MGWTGSSSYRMVRGFGSYRQSVPFQWMGFSHPRRPCLVYLPLFTTGSGRIWSKTPTRVSRRRWPTGKVTREGDGFRLRGRWKYLSGVDHSGWAILGGMIPDDGTGPEMRKFLVPMTDYKIDQSSWHVEGLQGTGSKDIMRHLRARLSNPNHRTGL